MGCDTRMTVKQFARHMDVPVDYVNDCFNIEEKTMSKYDKLWKYIQNRQEKAFKLTFDEIAEISGVPVDHSFLRYKKELMEYGYQVGRISMKEQTVIFSKLEG